MKKYILWFGVFVFIIVGFFALQITPVYAANCGGAVACSCGDTVTSNYILPGNLSCAGSHGLIVGANSITIDGDGFSIAGDSIETDEEYGIYNNGFDNVTITNVSITGFRQGIVFKNNSEYGGIISVTTNSNIGSGIYFESSNNATLTNNTANSNTGSSGISFQYSDGSTLTGNTANFNADNIKLSHFDNGTVTNNTTNSGGEGIGLFMSVGNVLTGNTMSDNTLNFSVSDGFFDNTIDTTNLIEGKPIYYLYDQHGTAENPLVYDGDVLGDISLFLVADSSYLTLKNLNLSRNVDSMDEKGIYFNNVTDSTIENANVSGFPKGITITNSSGNTLTENTITLNGHGIYFDTSSNNTLTGNTIVFNYTDGIYLTSSSSNTLENNVFESNGFGVYLTGSPNTLNNNHFISNYTDVYNDDVSTWSNNKSFHNLKTQKMFTVDEAIFTGRTKNIGDTVNFSISMLDPNVKDCPDCSYVITTSPSETVTSTKVDSDITGFFVPTKNGIYSLIFQISDSSGNITERKYSFLVGGTDTSTVRYFLRNTDPVHGQPASSEKHPDAKILSLTSPAPGSDENWYCSSWIQNSPDILHNVYDAVSSLNDIAIHGWYKSDDVGEISIERFASYDTFYDYKHDILAAADYTEEDASFSGVNWLMDYAKSWYWLSLKLRGRLPTWRSTSTLPSYADFTYEYATSPAVKLVSNEDIVLLSATEDVSRIATLTLENPTTEDTTTDIVLTDFIHPFLGATTSIASDSTATITGLSIRANYSNTISSVNASILPATGSIDVAISSWLTSGSYEKQWTEIGTGDLSVTHTIGDLNPGSVYLVTVDGKNLEHYAADNNGEISFTYEGPYSIHKFVVRNYGSGGGGGGASSSVGGCKVGDIVNPATGLPCPGIEVTPPPTAPNETPTCSLSLRLAYGSRGEEVKCLQTGLNEKITAGLVVDGMFGPLTKAAVIKFQLANQLVGDGIVGPLTRGVWNK